MNCYIVPGNSGRPVYKRIGKRLVVVSVIARGFHGSSINFAIPADRVRALLEEQAPPKIEA